jgi:hypothetical protein
MKMADLLSFILFFFVTFSFLALTGGGQSGKMLVRTAACLMPRLDVFGLANFHNGNSNMFYILYHRLRPNGSGDSSIYVLSRRSVTTIDTGAYLHLKSTEFSGALGSEAA